MGSIDAKPIVLITGANTDLGFEIARTLFARPQPYHILIGCRSDVSRVSNAISKLQQLSPDSSSTAEPLSIDITSEESKGTAFKEVQEQHGGVEILVNNAGTFPISQMIQLSAQCPYRLTLWHITGLALDTAVTSGQLSPRESFLGGGKGDANHVAPGFAFSFSS